MSDMNNRNFAGVCDSWRKAMEADRLKETVEDAPEGMSEDERKAYQEEVAKLRQQMQESYRPQYIKVAESDLETNDEPVKAIMVRHAYCPECGEELVAIGPVMYEPVTMAKMCLHKCAKCEKVYNLDYCYPRTVFLDENGKEIQAYTAL